MHSISPYSIRCFNQNLPANNKYCILNKVGSKDALVLLHDFIKSKTQAISSYDKTKQAYIFSDIAFDEKERRLSGWFKVGDYGVAGDIFNIKTGNKDYSKTTDNADMVMHYFQFYFPLDTNEGLCIFHSYKGRGVKTLFCDIFSPYFLLQTSLNLQFRPLSYEKAFQAWTDANVKELRVTKFTGMSDIADSIKKMGHFEAEVVIRPQKRGKFFGKFNDFNKKGSEGSTVVELLQGMGSQTKTVVELNGKRRTFIIGPDQTNSVCQIELDNTVKMKKGVPELESIHAWVNGIVVEYSQRIYPNKKVKP